MTDRLRREIGILFCLFTLGLFFGQTQAVAEDKQWTGNSGWWNEEANWRPSGQPQDGDNVYLTSAGGNKKFVYYFNTLYPNAVLNSLYIDDTGTGKMILVQGVNSYDHVLGTNTEYIGYSGTGVFIQKAGTHEVRETLVLGYDPSARGSYTLLGGNLKTLNAYVGYLGGRGKFTQFGGEHAASILSIGAHGELSAPGGIYNLYGGGLSAQFVVLGESGSGLFRIGDKGRLQTDSLTVGSRGIGTFIQNGGSVTTNTLLMAEIGSGTGSYFLNRGSLKAGSEIIGGEGIARFVHKGGTNRVDELRIGAFYVMDIGTYELGKHGRLRASVEYLGANGSGTFIQTGGKHAVTGNLYIGYTPTLVFGDWTSGGTYNLNAGKLSTTNTYVGYEGTGKFIQRGGIHAVSNLLSISERTGSTGTYSLMGGSLKAPQIQNKGVFNYSGGNLILNGGTFFNEGQLNLTGKGVRKIDGAVTNKGTVKVAKTKAVYAQPFINHGVYTGEQAMHSFNDLVVSTSGYLTSGYRDRWYINGDFVNYSVRNKDWNTRRSYLSFVSGVDRVHDMFLPGMDYGAIIEGYVNNFSWNVMNLSGNRLNLYDGDSLAGGAFYLREIRGLEIMGSRIDNISGTAGLNIYYGSELTGNQYLHGLTYELSGGGNLIPVWRTASASNPPNGNSEPVPEPTAVMLLGAGLIAWFGYKRCRRNLPPPGL